jgi:hypothetical protein
LTEDGGDRIDAFFAALNAHNWRDAARHQDWDALRNDLVVFVLRCSDEAVAWLPVIDYYDFVYTDDLLEVGVARGDDAAALLAECRTSSWYSL